jgi:hypothetical protein
MIFDTVAAAFRAGTEGTTTQRNLPPNCQAKDISNYRFPLLRATPRIASADARALRRQGINSRMA